MGRTHRLVLGWVGLLVMCWLVLHRPAPGATSAPEITVLVAGVIGAISMALLLTCVRRPPPRRQTGDIHAT